MTRQTFVSGGTNSHAGTIASRDDSMTTGDPLRAVSIHYAIQILTENETLMFFKSQTLFIVQFWLFVRHLGTHHDRCHHHVW